MGQPAEGNIVAFLGSKSILVRCPDSKCRNWIKLEFNFNGMQVDLQKAGVTQTALKPGSIALHAKAAAVVLGNPEF